MTVNEYNTKLNELRHPILAEGRKYTIDGRRRYSNPLLIAELAGNVIGLKDAAEEYMYVLAFDTKNHLLGLFEISHGTVNASLASAREIYMKLLLLGATYCIITHNHPSGDTTPSEADLRLTKTIADAGQILHIPLMDHIIIGRGWDGDIQYTSFREQGLLKIDDVAS